jgi:hypothetical protein
MSIHEQLSDDDNEGTATEKKRRPRAKTPFPDLLDVLVLVFDGFFDEPWG